MRALITWAEPDAPNLGLQALAAGAAALVRRVEPTCAIDYQSFPPGAFGEIISRRRMGEELFRSGAVREWLQSYDVILDTGQGDSFSEIYGLRRLSHIALFRRVAMREEIPLVLTPQTIGPFITRSGTAIARWSVMNSVQVLARDKASVRCGSELFGTAPALSTDLVFALPKLAGNSQAADGRVLFNVSGLLWNPNPHVDYLKYRDWCRELVKRCERNSISLALLAHVLDNPSADNDVLAVSALSNELGCASHVPRDLSEARSLIAACLAVVGARMHACLNAVSLGVPAIPWAYSRKFKPVFDELGLATIQDLRSGYTSPVDGTMSHLKQLESLRGAISRSRDRTEALVEVAEAAIRTARRGGSI